MELESSQPKRVNKSVYLLSEQNKRKNSSVSTANYA